MKVHPIAFACLVASGTSVHQVMAKAISAEDHYVGNHEDDEMVLDAIIPSRSLRGDVSISGERRKLEQQLKAIPEYDDTLAMVSTTSHHQQQSDPLIRGDSSSSSSTEDFIMDQQDMEDGLLFEGDIMPDHDEIMEAYGQEVVDELERQGVLAKQANTKQMMDGDQEEEDVVGVKNVNLHNRWNSRSGDVVQIPYKLSDSFSSSQKQLIEDALEDLEDRSKVVKFMPRTNENSYVDVIRSGGCWSYVGRYGGRQPLSLGSYCVRTGTVQHEFLHALGFWHEQSRTDRDDFVEIHYENIQADREGNFDKRSYGSSANNLGSEYDYGSVMHYSSKAFSKNGEVTIEAPQPIGQRDGADGEDIIQLRLLYQCSSGPRSKEEYDDDRCTSDCKCWLGASGCGGNDNACQGDLVCNNNRCREDDGGGTEEGSEEEGSGGGGGDNNNDEFVVFRTHLNSDYCIGLRGSDTTNTNIIYLHPCDDSPAQQWMFFDDGTIRSAMNTEKCIVGSGGSTSRGANLMIYDCLEDDPRFVFQKYDDDDTIRPGENDGQCIDVSNRERVDGNHLVQFYDCNGTDDKKWFW